MSTRATYTIINESDRTSISFYIHYDGYPAGAATYMHKALFTDCKGGFAEAFLRANPEAEFTPGKDAHGDTEHHYTITESKDGSISVIHGTFGRDSQAFNARKFNVQSTKDIADFINDAQEAGYKEHIAWAKKNNKSTDDITKLDRVHKAQSQYYGQNWGYTTVTKAREAFIAKAKEYIDYAVKWPTASGNLGMNEASMKKMQKVYADIVTAEAK